MNKNDLLAVVEVVGVGSLIIGGIITITAIACIVKFKKECDDKDQKIKVLEKIRKNYEKKFNNRMFANGESNDVDLNEEA